MKILLSWFSPRQNAGKVVTPWSLAVDLVVFHLDLRVASFLTNVDRVETDVSRVGALFEFSMCLLSKMNYPNRFFLQRCKCNRYIVSNYRICEKFDKIFWSLSRSKTWYVKFKLIGTILAYLVRARYVSFIFELIGASLYKKHVFCLPSILNDLKSNELAAVSRAKTLFVESCEKATGKMHV